MIETNTNLKEHINFFNDNKFVVFPCENKRPKVKFKDIQEQTVDELYNLFNDNDELAIRTGNGIVVIDIDTKGADGKEGFRSLEKLEKEFGKLPETLTAKTRSNGQHRYFRILDDLELSNRTNLNNLTGVDIRASNGYVIAPPTKNYEFTAYKKIAYLPKSWFDLIKRTPKVESNVINMNLLNDDGKIIDNRDDKASKIIWASLMEQCLFKHTDDITPDFNKLIDDSWENFQETCDTKNPNLTLEQEGRGLEWLTKKATYTWNKYLAGEFNDRIEDMIVETETFKKPEEDIKSNYIKVSDLMGKQVEPITWVIDQWLLEKTVCGLYAPAGTGKSAIAQALATCLSQAYDYGNKLKISKKYKTLYVACEDTTNIFQSRQKSINSNLGIFDEAGLENFLYMDRVGFDNRLASFDDGTDPKITKFYYYLEKVIKNEGVQFVVLDVLQDFFGGNEIVRSDVNFFLKSVLGKMVKDLGVTILVIAHPSLSGQMGHKYSGSTSWRGGFRSMWYLDKLDDNSNTLVLNKFKSNYSKSGDEENCYFKFENGCFVAYEKDQVESEDLKNSEPKVLQSIEYLNNQKTPLLKRGKLYLDIIQALIPEVPKELIDRCINNMQRRGIVKYMDKKGWLKS
mgnify:CR=1 FL=1